MLKLSVPSSEQLEVAYHQLMGKGPVSIEDWIQYSRMCRFDPRLSEAWLRRMLQEWKVIAANILREENLKLNSPGTLGVLLEQIEDYLIEKKNRKLYRLWKQNVLYRTPKGFGESFLIGVHPFASKKLQADAEYPLRSFLEWGFSGSDIFVNKAMRSERIRNTTGLGSEARLRKLRCFLSECKKMGKTRFTLDDYLAYHDHHVSKRVAQLDLRKAKNVRPHGQTKARFYTLE